MLSFRNASPLSDPAKQHSRSCSKQIYMRFLTSLLQVAIVILVISGEISARSIPEEERNHHHKHPPENAHTDPAMYLQKFGYLPGSDFETGALRTEEEFVRAIREFQRFANIPPTGKLDTVTVETMKKSRCGVQDLLESQGHPNKDFQMAMQAYSTQGTVIDSPQQYHLGPSKWQKNWLTFRLLNYTPDLRRDDAKNDIIRAFHVWGNVIPITFHEVTTGHADIYIQFSSGYHQDGYPFDGRGGVLAHAFFPGEERGGDVHFDEDEKWTVYSEEGTNLFIVAAHELGHSLGLAHSNVIGSLMYPWHQGYNANFRLAYDDILAIQTLYGSRPRARENTTTTTTTTRYTTKKLPTTKTTTTTTRKPTTTTTRTTTTRTTTTRTTTTRPTTKLTTKATTKGEHKHYYPAAPEYCDTSIDSISHIRGELFLFKGDQFWRINKNGLVKGYPIPIDRFWHGIPKHTKQIDAVFEKPDGKIVFFSGKIYWELYGNTLAGGFPSTGRPISDFGLPYDLDHVDAAFVWGHNKRAYIISGDMYWRLSDSKHTVEYGYPRDMSMWGGVRLPVDAAFTNKEGVTYFFHGPYFWEFNNARMHVRQEQPEDIGHHWLNCPPKLNNTLQAHYKSEDDHIQTKLEVIPSSSTLSVPHIFLLFLLNFLYLIEF